jgi:octaprenyl-diphosphate synthase
MVRENSLGALDSIRGPIRQECEALEEYFKSYLNTDVPIIDRIFEHLIDGGGKRFRPLLILLIASCSPKKVTEDAFRLAVAVEFIHTATLLHDDVVDQSDIRRGNRVAYRIWGAEPSVLSGDYLFSRAFNLLVNIGHIGILETISLSTTEMARGEVLQLLRSYSTTIKRQEYLEVIRGKTASLISASCKAAAFLAGFESRQVEAFKEYGLNLGFSFQIVDDVLDYTAEGGIFGKAIGKDFLEGKVTLPLIILMEHLNPEEQQLVSNIFLENTPDVEDFKQVMGLMKEHGAFREPMMIASQFRDTALGSLSDVVTGACRESLESIAEYVLERCS